VIFWRRKDAATSVLILVRLRLDSAVDSAMVWKRTEQFVSLFSITSVGLEVGP
jgi:hypothetical protein